MRIISRIIIILLVAALVAGGFYLAAGSSTTNSGPTGLDGQRPNRPEGGDREHEGGAALGIGLLEILFSLFKLSAIGGLVLLLQKGLRSSSNKNIGQSRSA